MREHFDLSEFDRTSPFYDQTNKKIIGKFKDELGGRPVLEFVGLKPKMYSFKLGNGHGEKKTAKGISKTVTKRLSHDEYLRQLWEPAPMYTTMCSIRQDAHQLLTLMQSKRALCSFDDKRYVCDDNIHTLAFGHYSLMDTS
jgi:hypothetical protein